LKRFWFLQYWLIGFISFVLFHISIVGCGPVETPPDAGLTCKQDDDCELGFICRFQKCQAFKEIYNTETTPTDGSERSTESTNPRENPLPKDESCIHGSTRICHSSPQPNNRGICKPGQQECKNGRWGTCVGEISPQKESCNNKDDDCDGQVDNQPDSQQPLSTECQNSCGKGKKVCYQGNWQVCNAPKPKVEQCNGKDDDCDGKIDNNLVPPLCNKQQGVCAGSRQKCGGQKGWQPCTEKEYQNHSNQHYQKKETRCDGRDNDCDGYVDPKPCACKQGATQSCYSGNPKSKNQGVCKAGIQKCNKGEWGSCVGEVLPTTEKCNGKDEDCDGKVDNLFGTTKPMQRVCKRGCSQQGIELCISGNWANCSAPQPQKEICNNKDDNCDGSIDENLTRPCTNRCGNGLEKCQLGKWQNCTAPQPQKEICNNKDDDCNGKIDDLSPRVCKTKCNQGQEFCQKGQWTKCSAPEPKKEICNNKDDDCNGRIDDNVYQACKTSCGTGKQQCYQGKWQTCSAPTPTTEVCNNKDDDCNGKVDDVRPRTCQSACGKGLQYCQNGNWQICTAPQSKPEVCNGKDDDCDGKVDNQPKTNYPLKSTCKSICGIGYMYCRNSRWSNCTAPKPTTEVCNNKDDDCNGQIDDQLSIPCSTSCGSGNKRCIKGSWTPCTAPQPKKELCNNKDDDCNGKVDDLASVTCSTACGKGVQKCEKGKLLPCTAPKPKEELCNTKDDDCDGKIDEICFSHKLHLYQKGTGFVPYIDASGEYIAVLTYNGDILYIQLKNAYQHWKFSSEVAAGAAFTYYPVEVSAGHKDHALFISARNTRYYPRLWQYKRYTKFYYVGKWTLPSTAKSVGDMAISPVDHTPFLLEPYANKVWKGEWQKTNKSYKWQALSLTYPNSTKPSAPYPCRPTRLAVKDKDHFAVTCTGYSWTYSPSLYRTYLQKLPFPSKYRASFSQRHVIVYTKENGKQVQKKLDLSSAPMDATFVKFNNKDYLLVSTAGTFHKTRVEPYLYLYRWPLTSSNIAKPIKVKVPATHFKLVARPIGVRATSDGVVILSVQEYLSTSTRYTFHQGRIFMLSLSALISGKWQQNQSFTLRNSPAFVAATPDGKKAVVLSTSSTHFDISWFTR